MAREILERALAFAVLAVGGRLDHRGPRCARTLELVFHIVDAHLDLVRDDVGMRLLSLACHVGHDHRPVRADTHLRAVAFANPGSFHEAESDGEPVHCRAHVRVDEYRDNRDRRNRAIMFHRGTFSSSRRPKSRRRVSRTRPRRGLLLRARMNSRSESRFKYFAGNTLTLSG